jgi:hypothetical protein
MITLSLVRKIFVAIYSSIYCSCIVPLRAFVRGTGRGKEEGRYEEKNGVPATLLKYVPTAYFLQPLANFLPLTNGPKNRRKMQGRRKDTTYFLLLLRLTDWALFNFGGRFSPKRFMFIPCCCDIGELYCVRCCVSGSCLCTLYKNYHTNLEPLELFPNV